MFGSCSLRLCVAYMQRNNHLGLDGTCHSSDFIGSWTSFGIIESCSPAAIPELCLCLQWKQDVDQLRQVVVCIMRTLQWALPEWERDVHSPYGQWLLFCHPAWEGMYGQDHCIIHTALASMQAVFVSNRGSTPCCMQVRSCTSSMCPTGKAFIFSFFFFPFPSSFHGPRLQLADLVPFSTFLAKMWCLQMKHTMTTMKISSICQI